MTRRSPAARTAPTAVRPSTLTVLTVLTVLGTLAALVTVLLTATTTSAVSSSGRDISTRRTRPADRAWVGFPIPRTGRAGSGWIGARRIRDGRVVYRTDPARRGTTRAFLRARSTRSFVAAGAGRVGPARTACAAIVLGRYGVPPGRSGAADRLQTAAVDVAVQHLLHGRGYRYDGAAQRRRTDQRANGPLIRAYAEKLLEDTCELAGPYRVALVASATSVDVGATVDHVATVLSRTGTPVPDVALTVTPGDGSAPYDVRTDDAGRFDFTVGAPRSGPLTTQVVTHRLAPSQVRFLRPRRRGASRVVVAGLKLGDAYPHSTTVAAVGQPTLVLGRPGPVALHTPFHLQLRLGSSYSTTRTATVAVFGPTTQPAPASGPDPRCRPALRRRQQEVAVGVDGTYRTADLMLGRRGTFVWSVSVPGDTYDKPVSRCGGQFTVR